MGAVPVVADHGGPGDIVTEEVGYRIPLDERAADGVRDLLGARAPRLRPQPPRISCAAAQQAYARERLSWEVKARMVTDVLLWSVSNGAKPVLTPPKALQIDK